MGRLLKIALVLLLPVVLVGGLIVVNYGAPDSDLVDGAIQAYLRYQETHFETELEVQERIRAIRPTDFTPAMSRLSFGDDFYFGVDVADRQEFPTIQPTTLLSTGLRTAGGGGSRPLPYPPVDVWCVWLNQPDSGTARVVFVVQHQDLYAASWVLHEAAAQDDPAALAADLAKLGCKRSGQ